MGVMLVCLKDIRRLYRKNDRCTVLPRLDIMKKTGRSRVINTYLLGPRATVCFVNQSPSPNETSTVEGPQNILLSRGISK